MKKVIIISSILVGVAAVVTVILYLIYPIERRKPLDVSQKMWDDTKRFYVETDQEVENVINGRIPEDQVFDPVAKKELEDGGWLTEYNAYYIDDPSSGSKNEQRLAKAMYNMSLDALTLETSYFQKKNGSEPDVDLQKAKADYDMDKKRVEEILFVWK